MQRQDAPSGRQSGSPRRRVVLLLAKSGLSASPLAEMERLTDKVARLPGVASAAFAFSEHGVPSFREVMTRLRRQEPDEILILPLLLPMEPGFRSWIARAIARQKREDPESWPEIRLAAGPGLGNAIDALLSELVAEPGEPLSRQPKIAENALVPAQKQRVLVCQGNACNEAGAALLWGYLRNEQDRLNLRNTGAGTMTAKSTCLGPCALAPVFQVWPEGTYYGGVDEHAIDRIIAEHLLEGRVVADYAYAPTGRKQSLREQPRTHSTEPEET